MTKHLTLLLFIGLAWGQAEAERFVKSSRENINQQNIDNYNITASSEEHFKERSISKLKTTNENYGRGSIVKAYIILASSHKPSAELIKEIQEFVKKQSAPYKYPREIEFVDSLPKTISGKIRRVELRENAANG